MNIGCSDDVSCCVSIEMRTICAAMLLEQTDMLGHKRTQKIVRLQMDGKWVREREGE